MRNEGKRDRKGKDVPKPTNKQEKNKKAQVAGSNPRLLTIENHLDN
jgi:hypothetical protein